MTDIQRNNIRRCAEEGKMSVQQIADLLGVTRQEVRKEYEKQLKENAQKCREEYIETKKKMR